jgi:hypothetical protein
MPDRVLLSVGRSGVDREKSAGVCGQPDLFLRRLVPLLSDSAAADANGAIEKKGSLRRIAVMQ